MTAPAEEPPAPVLLPPDDGSVAACRAEIRTDLRAIVAPRIDAAERSGAYPVEVLTELADRGYFRRRWARRPRGDIGRGVLLTAELGRLHCGGIATGVVLHGECALSVLARTRPVVQGRDLFAEAVDGRTRCCFSVSEPSGASNIADLQVTATRRDGGWVLQGTKRYTSLARVADVAVVLARTGGTGHLTFFAVPRERYEIVRTFEKLGTRSLDTCELVLDGVELTDEHVLGTPGSGFAHFSVALTYERLATVGQLVGALEAAIEIASGHLRHRATGDGVLWDHEALRHGVADLVALHGVLWQALLRVAAGVQHGHATQRDVVALKLFAARRVEHALSDALQYLGGAGYTTDWPLERAWRDSRLARLGAGADEVLRTILTSGTPSQEAYDAWLGGPA